MSQVEKVEVMDIDLISKSRDEVYIVGPTSEDDIRELGDVPDDYVLTHLRVNSWPIQSSDDKYTSEDGNPSVILANQIRGTFETNGLIQYTSHLISRLKDNSPVVPRNKYPVLPDTADNLLEINIPDLHFGSVIWNQHGENNGYSPEQAKKAFLESILKFVSRAQHIGFSKILFPIGNDYLHTDTHTFTTTGGTRLHNTIDWHQMFSEGKDLLIEAIEMLSSIAPVDILVIPGNHDSNTMYHIGMVLEAYFRNNDNICVDNKPPSSKCYLYGSSLIGFTHGKTITGHRLAAFMAEQWPKEWAASKFREWHLGHQHRKGGTWFAESGVVVEYLPSLCPADKWHLDNGFTSRNSQSAVAYLWSKDNGQIARFQHNLI